MKPSSLPALLLTLFLLASCATSQTAPAPAATVTGAPPAGDTAAEAAAAAEEDTESDVADTADGDTEGDEAEAADEGAEAADTADAESPEAPEPAAPAVEPAKPAKANTEWNFFSSQPTPAAGERHVLLLQMGSANPDLFRLLLARGQLPHFKMLLTRGRWSGSTDGGSLGDGEPAESLLVALTGKREPGWAAPRSFDRSILGFRERTTDPIESLERSVALPSASVADLLLARGHGMAGSIPAYGRTGGTQAASQSVLTAGIAPGAGPRAGRGNPITQASASVDSVLSQWRTAAQSSSSGLPALTVVSLDSLGQWAEKRGLSRLRGPHRRRRGATFVSDGRGVVDRHRNYCVKRKGAGDELEPLFKRVAAALEHHDSAAQFNRIQRSRDGSPQELCVRLPVLNLYAHPARDAQADTLGGMSDLPADGFSVLVWAAADLELGRLMDGLRSIRFGEKGAVQYNSSWGDGLDSYLSHGTAEHSWFESTLFLAITDHGATESRHRMAVGHAASDEEAGAAQVNQISGRSLAQDLAGEMQLKIPASSASQPAEDAHLALDAPWLQALPKRWPEGTIRDRAKELEEEAKAATSEIKNPAPWTRSLQTALIESDPITRDAVKEQRQHAFDEHVRLVVSTSAPGRAEIFLPSGVMGSPSWETRPTFEEILDYRPPESDDGKDIITALRENPAVGLIFVRKQNAKIGSSQPLPDPLEILVTDRFENHGVITVSHDASTGARMFRYVRDADSPKDPLGYGSLGEGGGAFGTWREWNDTSARRRHYYHNAVAAVGAYLDSNSPEIGDILVTHAQGWSFGRGMVTFGGLHREERLAPILVSGPGFTPGRLKTREHLRSRRDGELTSGDRAGVPVVGDLAPLITSYLGLGPEALPRFASDRGPEGFSAWRDHWLKDLAAQLGPAPEPPTPPAAATGLAAGETAQTTTQAAAVSAPPAPPPSAWERILLGTTAAVDDGWDAGELEINE